MAGILADYLEVFRDKRTNSFYVEGVSAPAPDDPPHSVTWNEDTHRFLNTSIETFRRLEKHKDSEEFTRALDEWLEVQGQEGEEEAWERLREIECAEDETTRRNLVQFIKHFQSLWS